MMKWFQHNSDSHTNPKMRQILRKYGVEGTGLFWLCCEIVAKDGEDYRITAKKEWKITLLDISRIEEKRFDEMLSFFADKDSINKTALKKGDLYIPKIKDYASNWIKRKDNKNNRVPTEGLPSNDRVPTAQEEQDNTIQDNTKEEQESNSSSCIKILKSWNASQSSPITNFQPENIIKKHGLERVKNLIKEYGGQNNGFSLFLSALKK